ncbi:MAG: transposase [Ferruginibacter sp.]|nr:transposase [Ferruginibacter sp.]
MESMDSPSRFLSGCERAGKKNSNNFDWQFWQLHNQSIEILNQKMFAEIVFYIHQNPVVSGFVYEAERGYTAAQNTMQKMMASLNWLNSVSGKLV